MLGRLTTLAGCILLAACATPEPVPVFHAVCVPESQIKAYTATQRAQAKAELAKLGEVAGEPPRTEVGQMIMDYAALIAADRECLKHQ